MMKCSCRVSGAKFGYVNINDQFSTFYGFFFVITLIVFSWSLYFPSRITRAHINYRKCQINKYINKCLEKTCHLVEKSGQTYPLIHNKNPLVFLLCWSKILYPKLYVSDYPAYTRVTCQHCQNQSLIFTGQNLTEKIEITANFS